MHIFINNLQRAKKHASSVKRKQEILKVYHSNDEPKKKIPTSKIVLGFSMIDFYVIQTFCMWYMVKYPEYSDFSSLIGIAAAILGQLGAIISYYRKSTAENTSGGIVYDSVLQQTNNTDNTVG